MGARLRLLTVACRPLLGTLQRTDTSWLCLQVCSGTCLWRHSVTELSLPVHCTLFMWMGPVPAGEGRNVHLKGSRSPKHCNSVYKRLNWTQAGQWKENLCLPRCVRLH